MARKTKPADTAAPGEGPLSKQDQVLALLRRPEGASIAEICKATGWKSNSARGFMSGALKKRLKLDVVSNKDEAGERRYHVAALSSQD